ncbi:unnamed protein product [Auanema sp. JU1783]|nr:unnamed protein product [Auanema sp. JU1783]
MTLGKVLRIAIPTTGVVTAYVLSNNDFGFRTALNKAINPADKAAFDRHFPRGKWDDNWDFRDPYHLIDPVKYEQADEVEKKNLIKENTATASRHLLLIRHGQYKMDTPDKFLTELGQEQAKIIGQRLAKSTINFDRLVMSTKNRATETANIILKELPPQLKRISCSLLEEGPPYPPVPELSTYRPSHSEYFIEGSRIESAFRRYFHRASPEQTTDSYEVVVCHANVIRYFVCRALQFPPEGWLRISLGNCSLTWVTVRPNGRVSLKMMGDVGHLPVDKISYS